MRGSATKRGRSGADAKDDDDDESKTRARTTGDVTKDARTHARDGKKSELSKGRFAVLEVKTRGVREVGLGLFAADEEAGRAASTSNTRGTKRDVANGERTNESETEEDPLDAFMAANDNQMDKERARGSERERTRAEGVRASEHAEAMDVCFANEGDGGRMEVPVASSLAMDSMDVEDGQLSPTAEDDLMATFAAAAKKVGETAPASRGHLGGLGANAAKKVAPKVMIIASKKPAVEVRRVATMGSAQVAPYVALKKNRKPSASAKILQEVFESDESEDENASAKRASDALAPLKEGDVVEDDDEAWAKKQTEKLSKVERLGTVPQDGVNYEPVRKNFYIEAKEITLMSKAEVRALRMALDGIKCRGKSVPRPIKTWAQAGLNNKVCELIRRSGFDKPMPIQAQALPVIMSGRDCIGIAKTGSGKTLAYILPMLRHINDQPPLARGDGPIGLIMGPTRELVTQIGKECKRFGKVMGFNTVAVYGGSGVAAQIGDLKRGTEIVACTPGRMIDLLTTSAGKITNLRRVTYMVLDEADRMFDMGFEPQITRILANLRPDRQTVMFSATFPHTMEALARAALLNPVEIQIGGKSVVNSDIEQLVEVRPEEDRFLRMLELLGEWYERGKVIIFVASQDKCDTIFRDLLKSGYPCLSLHGGKEQSDRQSTISDFKSDVCNVLIATSIAARGLDVKELRLVINYDAPNHLEDYVHRVGRTGRAGNKGTAVTFISEDEEKFAPDLVKALKDSKQPIPNDLQAMADNFMRKRKEGIVGVASSGFGGSGFKFSKEETDAMRKSRRANARAVGLAIDDGESDSEEEPVFAGGDEDEAPIYASVGPSGQAAAHAAQAAAHAAAQAAAPTPSNALATPTSGMTPAQIAQAAAQSVFAKIKPSSMGQKPAQSPASSQQSATLLAAARAAAGKISSNIASTAGAQSAIALATNFALAHGASAGAAKAAALAAVLNQQHGIATQKPPAVSHDGGSHFETELEINDFPQFARYKVTQKDTLAAIMELTGAAVTAKGQYCAPGRSLAPGDRKLYLLIEGPSERVVKEGKNYVKQIIEGAIAKQALPGAAGQPQGRYKI